MTATSVSPVLLIVGRPGVGKTTLIEQIRTWCPRMTIDGFITREVRDAWGNRIGFDLIDWRTGQHFPLARVAWQNAPARVGKYGVRPDVLDTFVEIMVHRNPTPPALWIVDELGKMESFSERFLTWLDGLSFPPTRAVMTGPAKPVSVFQRRIERWRPQVLTVTPRNRSAVGEQLRIWLRGHGLGA